MELLKRLFNKGNQNGSKRSTTSHHIVYTVLIMYVSVTIWGAILTTILAFKNPDVAVQLLIPYFSFVAAFGAVIPFYLNKAKVENDRKLSMAKDTFRLDMAKEIHELTNTNKVSPESISLTKILISDTDTEVNIGGLGEPSVIDSTTYTAPPPPST